MGESGTTYNGNDQRWEGIEAEAITDRFDLLTPSSSRHARHESLHPPGLQQHPTKPSKPEPMYHQFEPHPPSACDREMLT